MTSAWLLLLLVIAAFPFVASASGLFTADVLPMILAVLLSVIALLAAGRLPGNSAIHNYRAATRQLAVRTTLARRHLVRLAHHLPGILHSLWHNPYQSLQRSLKHRLTQRQQSDEQQHWPLTGSLWIGIGGLLLAAFISTG